MRAFKLKVYRLPARATQADRPQFVAEHTVRARHVDGARDEARRVVATYGRIRALSFTRADGATGLVAHVVDREVPAPPRVLRGRR